MYIHCLSAWVVVDCGYTRHIFLYIQSRFEVVCVVCVIMMVTQRITLTVCCILICTRVMELYIRRLISLYLVGWLSVEKAPCCHITVASGLYTHANRVWVGYEAMSVECVWYLFSLYITFADNPWMASDIYREKSKLNVNFSLYGPRLICDFMIIVGHSSTASGL